jgi:glutamate synthase (NADPH/NADH) small chain
MTKPKKKTIRTIPQQRTPVREQDATARARNFDEVSLGYGNDEALIEAERCLQCPEQPCISGCPVNIDIPGFIQKLCDRDFRGAYEVITASNLLPAVCGRVCPQESQCEGVCTVGDTLEPVAIGRLERFVGDTAIAEGWNRAEPDVGRVFRLGALGAPGGLGPPDVRQHTGASVTPRIDEPFRIGIVGSGPAGLACAADMAKAGCEVTVYEAFHLPGGVLRYGIPDFRLPKQVIDAEIEHLETLGVRFECNTLVGRLFTIEQMLDELRFDAVFVGTGAGYPAMPGIPGDSLNGVLSANELLTRCNLMRARDFPDFDTPLPRGRRVAVIGAGNTAMDAMRVCLRLGADAVLCLYRRSKTECPARAEEVHHAEQEGVRFHWLTAPIEIYDEGRGGVRGVRCQRMELGEPDDSGRRRPVPVPGSEHDLDVDLVVFAIGTQANPIIGQTCRLKLNKRGYIETDDALATSMAGVFAGGDIVTGAATVIEAMGAGRKAARAMKAYLGIRDRQPLYANGRHEETGMLFGIDAREHNFVRVKAGWS